jgi:hypothetical protein
MKRTVWAHTSQAELCPKPTLQNSFLTLIFILIVGVLNGQKFLESPTIEKLQYRVPALSVGALNGDGVNDIFGASATLNRELNESNAPVFINALNGKLDSVLKMSYMGSFPGMRDVLCLDRNVTDEILFAQGNIIQFLVRKELEFVFIDTHTIS